MARPMTKAPNPIDEAVAEAEALAQMTERATAKDAEQAAQPKPAPTDSGDWVGRLTGPREVQSEADMYRESLGGSGGPGGILTASKVNMTIWYHEDGSTSLLDSRLDWYYGQKPGFHKAENGKEPAWWLNLRQYTVRCPHHKCTEHIRVEMDASAADLEAVGLAAPDMKKSIRTSLLRHIKRYHPSLYVAQRSAGAVSDEEDKLL